MSLAEGEESAGCPPHDVRTDVVPLWSAPKDRGGIRTGQVVIRYCIRCPWEDIHKCAFGDDGDCDPSDALHRTNAAAG